MCSGAHGATAATDDDALKHRRHRRAHRRRTRRRCRRRRFCAAFIDRRLGLLLRHLLLGAPSISPLSPPAPWLLSSC